MYPTVDEDQIKEFITDPLLWALTHGDEDPKLWNPEFATKKYMLIRKATGEVSSDVGIIEYYPFNDKVVTAHYYISPRYWGSKIGVAATLEGINYLKSHTGYTSALAKVGKPHYQVQVMLKELGFDCIGRLKDAVTVNKEVTDLFLFQLNFTKE